MITNESKIPDRATIQCVNFAKSPEYLVSWPGASSLSPSAHAQAQAAL